MFMKKTTDREKNNNNDNDNNNTNKNANNNNNNKLIFKVILTYKNCSNTIYKK